MNCVIFFSQDDLEWPALPLGDDEDVPSLALDSEPMDDGITVMLLPISALNLANSAEQREEWYCF